MNRSEINESVWSRLPGFSIYEVVAAPHDWVQLRQLSRLELPIRGSFRSEEPLWTIPEVLDAQD